MDSIKDAEAFHAKVKIHYLGKEFIKTKRAWVLIGIGLLKVIVNTEKKRGKTYCENTKWSANLI